MTYPTVVARARTASGGRLIIAATDEVTLFDHAWPRMGNTYRQITIPQLGEIWEPSDSIAHAEAIPNV